MTGHNVRRSIRRTTREPVKLEPISKSHLGRTLLETWMTGAFEIREIGDDDLAEVVGLLCEGFPRRTPEYWRTGLQKLANRERPPDTEKYGYVLTAGNELRGVVLPFRPFTRMVQSATFSLIFQAGTCSRHSVDRPPKNSIGTRVAVKVSLKRISLRPHIRSADLRSQRSARPHANTGCGPELFIASSATMSGRYPQQLEGINGLYDARGRSRPRLLVICA